MKSLIDLKKIDLGAMKIQLPRRIVKKTTEESPEKAPAEIVQETLPEAPTPTPVPEVPEVKEAAPEPVQAPPEAIPAETPKAPIVQKIDRTLNYWLIGAFIVAVLVIIFQTFEIKLPNTKSLVTRPTVTQEIPVPTAKVLDVAKFMIAIELPDGSVVKRTGGSQSWRLHNPGRLSYGKFAKTQGAIGSDGRYAVFLTEEDGRKANKIMLFEDQRMGYSNLTILQAVEKYAPETIGGRPLQYAMVLAKAAGTKTSTLMRELNEEQRDKVLDAIQVMESYTKGYIWTYKTVEEYKKQG